MQLRIRAWWPLMVFAAVMLIPASAFAEGSDTGRFSKIMCDHGPLVAIAASFAGGIVASLTPCVFPMVPITVSVFGATETQSRMRGAALSATFVLGIAALFVPLGMFFALSGKLMGSALSNPYVVSGIAVVFIALAASMFGAFELTLPAGLNNRLSTVGGIGFKGAFLIGLVMGLVAAPCTGPFLTGLVIWISTTKSVALGAACMFSFALGLGLIFFVAGTFAVNLPKGGAWMMGIKWGSGVVLAYMALSYLRDGFPKVFKALASSSNPYIAVGAVLATVGLALGILHVMGERKKSPLKKYSKPSKLVSIIPAIAGLFMVVTWSNQPKESAGPIVAEVAGGAPKIAWLTKEDAAFAKAKAEGKPVLIDFGAEWCKACKELEEQTWPDPKVRAEAARYVALKIDATDDDDPEVKRLSKKYGVVGLPVVIVIDPNGKELTRYTEFVKPDTMATALKPTSGEMVAQGPATERCASP